jgi:hypothetical protein
MATEELYPHMPSLPATARLPHGLGADASPWLDRYIGFSRKWSPRAYDGFHEAVGLWVLSTVAARRLIVHFGRPRYSPLIIALAARTSLFAKSTTTEIGTELLHGAGLDWMLAPDQATPQKFVSNCSGRVPDGYVGLRVDAQARARSRLAFAGQQGWFYEEFGQHLRAMTRANGTMAEFRGIIRRFDDCPQRFEYSTIGRGSDVVDRPYLALLANMTPADLRPLAKRGSSMWGDGFWARFAFVTPPTVERRLDRFPRTERPIPHALVEPLRSWHQRLGIPVVQVRGGEGEPYVAAVTPQQPMIISLGDGVFDAIYRYSEGLTAIIQSSDLPDLDGNYSRFPEKAIRISMLITSLEGGDTIEMRHWARAQEVAERWRACLHALYQQVNDPGPSKAEQDEEKVLRVLRRRGELTAAQVSRFVRGLSTSETKVILEGLVEAGEVVSRSTARTVRYSLPSQGTVDNIDR